MTTRRRSSWRASSGSTAAEPRSLDSTRMSGVILEAQLSTTAADNISHSETARERWVLEGTGAGEAAWLLGKHRGESSPDQLRRA